MPASSALGRGAARTAALTMKARCWGAPSRPYSRPLSNTHSTSVSRSPAMGRSSTTRSSHSSIETMGDPRNRAALENGGWPRSSSGTSAGSADQGTAATTASASMRCDDGARAAAHVRLRLRALDVVHGARPSALDLHRLDEGPPVHHAAARLEVARRAARAAGRTRRAGRRGARRRAARRNASRNTSRNRTAAARSGVSFRIAVASGSQSSCRVASPCPVRRNHSARVSPRGTRPSRAARPKRSTSSRDRHGQAQRQQPGQEVPGRGELRAVERRPSAVVAPVDPQVVLDDQEVRGAGTPQEVEGRLVRPRS